MSPPYWEVGEEVDTPVYCWVSAVAPDPRPELFHLLRNLFAGVVYHRDFLEERMHSGNAVRQSHGWWLMPTELLDKVRVGYPWDSTPGMPALTGIPPHTSILAELAKLRVDSADLKSDMAALPAKVQLALRAELDRRADEREGGGHLAAGG